MKHILVIPDGAADEPLAEHEGKTVFEIAETPALDAMAREGRLGLAATVPDGMHPGSDVANLALLGYDPRKGYTGRAALEAAALDITVPEGDAVFRANLVTVTDGGKMDDYSAGHITTAEGRELIEELSRGLNIPGITLFPGVGYRHICLMQGAGAAVPECMPPHEIIGQDIAAHQPSGPLAGRVLELENRSRELFAGYAVNQRRLAEGRKPATQAWLWGGATAMTLENFCARTGLQSAGLITAVDLLRGIAKLAGMDVLEVEGATAYLDTNYAGKGRAALEYIQDHDFVAVHVEAPDEAGHNGDLTGKIKAMEDIDRHILAPLYAYARQSGGCRIMVAPDHPTPVETRVHDSNPVPYVIWGEGFAANGAAAFSEREAARTGGPAVFAPELLTEMTRGQG